MLAACAAEIGVNGPWFPDCAPLFAPSAPRADSEFDAGARDAPAPAIGADLAASSAADGSPVLAQPTSQTIATRHRDASFMG